MLDFIKIHIWETIWLLVTAVISYIVGLLHKRVQREITEQKLIKEGLLAILHDRLYQSCIYFIEQGYITVSALKNLEYLYEGYHALGGNGTGTELYDTCRKLRKVPDGALGSEE